MQKNTSSNNVSSHFPATTSIVYSGEAADAARNRATAKRETRTNRNAATNAIKQVFLRANYSITSSLACSGEYE